MLFRSIDTAADLEDIEKWIMWDSKDVGIVLPYDGPMGILVLTPAGSGVCFYDEIVVIK